MDQNIKYHLDMETDHLTNAASPEDRKDVLSLFQT
jgi:hypothetical protein